MLRTTSGSDITVEIPYEFNGESLTLTGFTYKVYDATGNVLQDTTSDPNFNTANTSSSLVIDGSINVTTDFVDIRTVECSLITTSGTYRVVDYYEIIGDILKLTPLTDSFMYFPESMIVRKNISEPMDYYDELDNETKAVVLRNAFERLIELKFTVGTLTGISLADYTLDQFSGLDPKFILSLKKAQIAEANHIVEINPVKEKIRMGVISETIGESSMFFKQNAAVDKSYYPGISDHAYPYIAKYLYKDTSNSQIWKLRRS